MSQLKTRQTFQPAIGIETHVQLKTKTKLFCSCLNDAKVEEPNINVCPICMGFPGSLPVLNETAIMLALRLGIALNGKIAQETKFDRKNYFYPDLPKGYQISQYDQPIVGQGEVEIPFADTKFRVGIIRAHLEEDAGKLLHPAGADYSLLDLNRAGTPLMEIVSAPDIKSAAQAKAYVQEIYNIVRYAQVSEVDLYRGNMRFDVNVSVAEQGAKELGTRSETKNLNSFRSVERAVEYEINRQIELLAKGQAIVQETRGWDEAKGKTTSQRSKEEAHDYRYFPEPDLPPLVITKSIESEARSQLPNLPSQIRAAFAKAGLDAATIEVILDNPQDVELLQAIKKPSEVAGVANYLTGKLRAYRNDHLGKTIQMEAAYLQELFQMATNNEIGSSAADEILVEIIETGKKPREIAKAKHLLQVSDIGKIEEIVEKVMKAHAQAVEDYARGQEQSLQFLVGQVMKESKGRANPQLASDLLKQRIKVS